MHAGLALTASLLSCVIMGQISASLAAMHRTVEDYDSMAKREIIKAKQEKAMMYVPSLHHQLLATAFGGASGDPLQDSPQALLTHCTKPGVYRSSVQTTLTCERSSNA